MPDATTERRWVCLGCGEPWEAPDDGQADRCYTDAPLLSDRCPCGDERWTSQAANAERIGVYAMERGTDGLMHRVEATSAEAALGEVIANCADALAESRAECERLRVIVDLAIAVTHPQTREQWRKAQLPFIQAVEAEVERRAAAK